MLENEGLTKDDVINHFCEVNKCTHEQFEEHEEEEFKIYAKRSQHKWSQDFGEYKNLIEPILSKLRK